MSFGPVRVLKATAQEERGENARLSSFVGATAIGDLVKTTLGPKGMVCSKRKKQKSSRKFSRTKY
jgi:T-complex protein 1 subunit beta